MKKNFLAILLGIAISVLSLSMVEIFFQLNERYGWLSPRISNHGEMPNWDIKASEDLYKKFKSEDVFKWTALNPVSDDEALRAEGNKAKPAIYPCCVGTEKLAKNKDYVEVVSTNVTHRVLFEAHYTLDALARRITPQRQHYDYNILMFGDSYTLGVGVNNEESPAYQLGLRRPKAQVYNFGLTGGGPHEILYELSTNVASRFNDIEKKKTIVLYTYMSNHFERLFCRSICFNFPWMTRYPYYDREDDKVKFKGFFHTDRKFLNFLYSLANKSALLRHFDVVLPPTFTQEHIDFFADVVAEQKAFAEKRFGDVDFYLVFYPGASEYLNRDLMTACKQRGIKVLDYSRIEPNIATGNKADIIGEGHPSPISQYIFGYLLDRDLPQH